MTTSPRDRVLDAFERSLLLHGVQGASFARIAAEGGFHRSLVQHHFKTRDRLVDACIDRVVCRYRARLAEVREEDPSPGHLLDWLCSPHGADGPPRMAQVVDAFVALANTDASVARRLAPLYAGFVEALDLDADVAFACVALSFGRAGLETLGFPAASGPAAREACRRLAGV